MKPKAEKKPKFDWTWVTWRELENGISQYECYTKKQPHPTGVVWGFSYKTHGGARGFMVMKSYTQEYARRRGVRTAIHKEMAKHFALVMSFDGTADGAAWMKAQGYKRQTVNGPWLWVNPKPPAVNKGAKS